MYADALMQQKYCIKASFFFLLECHEEAHTDAPF